MIGTNKKCASDTVCMLLQDFEDNQQPDVVDFNAWTRIDKAEMAAGAARQRPRVKFIDINSMLDAARGRE